MIAARLALVSVLFAGCAVATWPQVIAVGDLRAQPLARGDWIETYEDAIVSIAAIMTRDLGLPDLQASLYLHRDREAFRAALEADGYDPAFARDTAAALTAVSGFRRVIVNENGLRDVGWHYRVGVLAHELTHTLQYEFSGGSRGTSEQWLREGFAEWVEVEVLVALGFTTRRQARTIAVNQLRDAGAPPPLSRMVTFPDWVALAQRGGQEPIYAQALLAAELLLDRHGVPAAIEYFTLFASSDDRLANFRQAFGEELSDFDRAFAAHAAALVR
jgi:nucleotide-binding universal stress UspA family protein